MARRRNVERIPFSPDDLAPIVARMEQMAASEDGWINLIPIDEDEQTTPSRLGFSAMFGGGSIGITMCTWVPGSLKSHGESPPSLGITHNHGRRILTELQSGAAVIPVGWRVEQDHPRRGLVLRVPADEPYEKVLRWAILTVSLLGGPRPGVRWYADAYMPT